MIKFRQVWCNWFACLNYDAGHAEINQSENIEQKLLRQHYRQCYLH
uniref:Uncharacterized protein n=1 Tax=Arundo donax TaxID=35708 RepID=A0A0A9CB91_ARUDO